MNNNKHTQGELKISPHPSKDVGYLLQDKNDFTIAYLYFWLSGNNCVPIRKEETKADAEHLALCWNNHDKLVDALKEILRFKHELRLVMGEKLQSPDNFFKAINTADDLLKSLDNK